MGCRALVLTRIPPLFIYDTLCHRPMLNIVLGNSDHLVISDAILADHGVFWAAGNCFPVIQKYPGASAKGILVSGLTAADIENLDYYEGGFKFELAACKVTVGDGFRAAQIYLPGEGAREPGQPWCLGDWIAKWSAISLRAADEIMGSRGSVSAAEIASRFSQIMQRAASGVRAVSNENPFRVRSDFDRSKVREFNKSRPYMNFFAIEEQEVSYTKFDGTMSEKVARAAFIGGDAVIVLPYDPVRDRVMIIEQFRFGLFVRGDTRPWSLEAIAGRIDAGETPQETAHREAQEETGLDIRKLLPIAQYYPSPGAVTEYLYSFIGLAELPDEAAGIGGLSSEAEDIKSHILEFADLMALIFSGEVEDGQLILSAMWLAGQRDLIRQNA